jgi:peptide/nickel transport system substrate-binding protein
LRERGYATVAADGSRRGSGPTLTFDLVTNSGNKLREDTLVKIQGQLARVGVEARIRSLEQRALIQQAMRGEFDAYLGGWNFTGRIPLETLFGSASVPPDGFNVVRYSSSAVDANLAQLALATDRPSMKPVLHAIQSRIHDDQPYTFLFERQGIVAHGPGLGGVTVDVPSDPLAGLDRFWVVGR